MTICRACSSEITGPDRYCRNCGVPVAPTIVELDDTRRFHASGPLPSSPAASAWPPDTTNPLIAPQYAAYAAPQASAPPGQSESFIKKWLKRKPVLASLMFSLIVVFFLVGLGIGNSMSSHGGGGRVDELLRPSEDSDPESLRRKYEEAVQNALGFKQGEFSAADFPDQQGIFVNSLMSDDSPAALAKIQAGDLITELNDQPVRNDSELSQILDSLEMGKEVPVKVYRDGEILSLRIKIADRAFPPLQPKVASRDQGFLGILNSSRRCCVPGTKKWGVEVSELQLNGPAEIFGLREGDLITEFNGHPVKTPNEFNRRIRSIKPGSKVKLTFYRGAVEQKIEVILGHRWDSDEESGRIRGLRR
jgi:S1-C subfamily serine protease